jgi:hypothetical protein
MADDEKKINEACDAIERGGDYMTVQRLLVKIESRDRTVWQKTRNPLICAVSLNCLWLVIL